MSEAVDIDPIISKLLEGGFAIHFVLFRFWAFFIWLSVQILCA